jgi:uncharacterized protein YegP (UPF0339 family)
MKPIEQTSSRLIFEKNNTLACALLLTFILPFALVPLFFTYFILPRQQVLNCDRLSNTTINCRIEHKILGIKLQEKTIQNLIEAKVIAEEVDTEDSSYLNYRVRLAAENGETLFSSDRSTYYLTKLKANPQQNIILYNGVSKKEAEKIAGIIKDFLGCQN